MKRVALAALASLALATPSLADGKVYVQLPDLGDYKGQEAREFLYELVLANVVSSNCVGYEITEEEWSLLTDSADIIGYGELKLDAATFDDEYYAPAFAALDEAGTCEEWGPQVPGIVDTLVSHGGSRDPLPDQDKAYEEWRAFMDELRAQAEQGGQTATNGKTKTK